MNERLNKHFKDIFKDSARFSRRHWLSLVKMSIPFFIPVVFLAGIIDLEVKYGYTIVAHFNLLINTLIYYFISTLMFLAALIYTAALMTFIDALNKSKTLSIFQAYQAAVKNLLPLAFVQILSMGKILLWFLALIIPGIYRASLYSFAWISVLLDGKRGEEALEFSKKILKPNLVKYLDYLLFSFLGTFFICVPFLICLEFVLEYSFLKEVYWMLHIINIIEAIMLVLAGHFLIIFLYCLYEEFKGRIA